jgi:outer membrane protein assembly factor BamB
VKRLMRPLFSRFSVTLVLILYLSVPGPMRADLFVASFSSGSILRFSSSGTLLGSFVTPGSGGLTRPAAPVFGPDGNLYVLDNGGNRVLRYNGSSGAFMDAFVPSVLGPEGSVFGPDGNLYITGRATNDVRKYNGTTGAFMGVFASGGNLVVSVALAFGPDGNLYVADEVKVVKFNGSTGALIGTFVPAGSGGLTGPSQLVFGKDGNLYVGSGSSSANSGVLRFNGTTGAFISQFVPSIGVRADGGLAFGPDGNLYVGYFNGGVPSDFIRRYNGQTGAPIDTFIPSGVIGIIAGFTFSASGSSGNACGATDVTGQVTISRGPIFGIPPFVGLSRETIFIRNGSQAIPGPLSFVLRGIPSSTTSLAGVYPGLTATHCFSTAPAGDTLFLLDTLLPPGNADVLQPGEVLQFGLTFASGQNAPTPGQPLLLSGTPNQ